GGVGTPEASEITLDTAAPTDSPLDTGPTIARLGEAIRITCDSADCLDVTVLKAQSASRYRDPGGSYLDDVPTHKGDIFLAVQVRSEEHTSELQSRGHLVCRLLLEKKKSMFSSLLAAAPARMPAARRASERAGRL